MKAEYVSPVVAYLCTEECPDSGIVVEAGGGWFAKVRWQQSNGFSHDDILNQPFTPEIVRKGWKIGSDFSENPHYPNWDFTDRQKHSNPGHTLNLLQQGLMQPMRPNKTAARNAKL